MEREVEAHIFFSASSYVELRLLCYWIRLEVPLPDLSSLFFQVWLGTRGLDTLRSNPKNI